jgi:hypothetical protein
MFTGSDAMVFLDASAAATFNGGSAGSVGAGLRYYDESRNRLWGASGWWDYDDGHSKPYQQVGASFESIGRWFDFRANGYFGLGDNTNILSANLTGTSTPTTFADGSNGFLAGVRQRVESSYSGFNAEVGGPMAVLGRYGFEAYVGAYHLSTDDDENITGPQVRIESHVTDDLRLGMNVTKDDVFGTQVYGTVVLQFPDGRPQNWFRPRSVRSKMLDRVERRSRVTTHTRTKETTIRATMALMPPIGANAGAGLTATDLAAQPTLVNGIVYVNPDATVNGVGSSVSPFNTFENFPTQSPSTLILVQGGDITGQVTLTDGNLLVSENYAAQGGLMLETALGALALPFDATEPVPTWSNPSGGTLITVVGDRTEIAGFDFDGRTNLGPLNTIVSANGVEGIRIHDNTFRNYSTGVSLRNTTGTFAAASPVIVYANNFLGQSGDSYNGFVLENTGPGTTDLELGDTEFNRLLAGLTLTDTRVLSNVAYGNTGEDTNGNGVLDPGEDDNQNLTLDTGAGFTVTAMSRAVINARIAGNLATREPDSNSDGVTNSEDLNNNGVLDLGEDLNGNGILDFGDDLNRNGRQDLGNGEGFVITAGATQSVINLSMINNIATASVGNGVTLNANASVINAATFGEDVNGNGVLDTEDQNRNGILDIAEDGEDRNANGLLDSGEDLNGNGVLDGPNGIIDTEDVNGNGILDGSEDVNGNGTLDAGEDLNNNGVIDPAEDVNGNGLIDTEDVNGNGVLDINEDLNGNGAIDAVEDANEDTNGNGILDVAELPGANRDGFLNRGNNNGLLDGGQIIRGNVIERNGGDGIQVNSTNNAVVSLRLTSNLIGDANDRTTGNGGIGFNVNADSGTVTADIGYLYNEDLNSDGILNLGEDTNGNGRLDVPRAQDGNQFVANALGAMNFNLSGTALGNLNVIGNTLIGRGGGQIQFLVSGSAVTPGLLTGQSFQFTNVSGVGIDIEEFNWNVAAASLEFNTNTPADAFQALTSEIGNAAPGLLSVNGSTGPFVVPDVSTALNLVFGDLNAGNGILDTGEDLNANNILDSGEDIGEVFSFQIDLDAAGIANSDVYATDAAAIAQAAVPTASVEDSIVTVKFSTGQVVRGTLQPTAVGATTAQFVPTVNNVGTGTGLSLVTSGNAVVQNSTIQNNRISDFGGTGLLVRSTESGNVDDLLIRNNVIANNGNNNGLGGFQSGVSLQTSNAPFSTLNAQLSARVLNNMISDNTNGGFEAIATSGTLTLTQFDNNVVDGNGRGVFLSASQAASLTGRIHGNDLINSVANPDSLGVTTTATGLEVLADNGTILLSDVADNIISNNAGDGVQFGAINGASLTISPTEDVNANGRLDSGEDVNEDTNGNAVLDPGEDVNLDGLLNVGNGNGLLDVGLRNNTLINNRGNTFAVDSRNSTVELNDVANNVIAFNTAGTGGFAINGVNSTITGAFRSNTVTGDPANNPNAGPGFLMETSGGLFNIEVGGTTPEDGNLFSSARGAGVAFVMTDTGSGAFTIQNNQITGIVDDVNTLTPYQGDGISVSLVGSDAIPSATAVLTRSDIIGNVIGNFTNPALGTAGSGVAVLLSENTAIEDLLIQGNRIGHAGNDNDPTTAANTADAGIEFNRLDNAELNIVNPRPGDTRSAIIDGNIVRNSGQAFGTSQVDGLSINVMNGIRDDIDFQARNNEFTDSTGNGVFLNTQADASLAVDLTNNLIENSGFDGIRMDGVEIVANDLETQGGVWTKNTIRNNARFGIAINSVAGGEIPLIIGQNGVDPVDGRSFGNIIELNGDDGIQTISGGSIQINNNVIARNGQDAALVAAGGGHGIDINNDNVLTFSALIQNNSIVENAGDGIEILNRGDGINVGGFVLDNLTTILALGNSITNNAGRGVDLLNQPITSGSPDLNVRFGDDTLAGMNFISSNGLEGFYAVNTASSVQTQDVLSSIGLDRTGNALARPDMVIDLSRNEISANNNSAAGGFAGGGFVLRVGSSGALQAANSGSVVPDTTGFQANSSPTAENVVGVGSNSSLFGNGRVNARVINNTFQGNLGEDVFIESFVSTADPVTGGTWTAMAFTPAAGSQTDPLARLNMVFRGNVGNSLIVSDPADAYTNADAVFKSRINTATPPGPFTSATRNRSIQRVAARGTLPPGAGSLDNGQYNYPGVGSSTFRIESDVDVSGFSTIPGQVTGDGFMFDPVFQVPTANPNSVGWEPVAIGTFDFDLAFGPQFLP